MSRHPQFPVLSLIDAVRGPEVAPFACDPLAAALERRARELTAEFWPDHVWFTGRISPALLGAVTRRLEADRTAMHDRVQVMVIAGQPSTPRA